MGQSKTLAPSDIGALVLIASIWGVNNLFAKLIVMHLPPLFAAGVRFAITAAAMVWFMKRPPANWKVLLLICLFIGPLHFGVQNVGLAMAKDLSPMVIGMQLWIPASVAAAALILGERVSWLRGFGLGLSFLGIVVLAFEPNVFAQLDALLLVSIAAIAYGIGAVLVRRHVSINPLQMQGWIAILSAPLLFGASAGAEQGQLVQATAAPWWIWVMIAFGALASSLGANALMFLLVQRYEVARTTPYILASPIIAISLGVAVLHDPVTVQLLAGAALALIGVAIVALAERRGR
ncbi:MAG: DMT family transporter [Caulobacterales bacterium]|jgi:O-acetylserine/cysteine efflux transporter